MTKLKLALDWTPNINHIGFFVAKDKGFYKDLGLDIELVNPSDDNYELTPAKKVELGLADLALCPTESILSYRSKKSPFQLIAISSILQEDLSAIVVLEKNGINTPKDLDNKIYSSYKARYEDGIVKEMMKNDGGKGDLQIIYPQKLGIWNTLLTGVADATWIFLNWEGILAEDMSEKFTYFKLDDYQIPYSYSPVIAANEASVDKDLKKYQLFLQATKKGYLYCKEFQQEAIELFAKYISKEDQTINLEKALAYTAPYFGNEQTFGLLSETVVTQFLEWIALKGLEEKKFDLNEVITNVCWS